MYLPKFQNKRNILVDLLIYFFAALSDLHAASFEILQEDRRIISSWIKQLCVCVCVYQGEREGKPWHGLGWFDYHVPGFIVTELGCVYTQLKHKPPHLPLTYNHGFD